MDKQSLPLRDKSLVSIGQTAKLLGISIDTLRRWDKNGKFSSVRIDPSGNRYYRKPDIDLYVNDQLAVIRKWAVSSLGYEPDLAYFCKTRDIFQARLEHLQSDLIKNIDPNFASLISAIVGEIGNNSFDHNLGNWPDILGVYFAYSLSEKRILLADRGIGILSTLKKTLPELKDHKEALTIAFTQNISGRAPESRGNGLKFVRNVVTQNPITLFFQTGNAVLNLGKQSLADKAGKQSLADKAGKEDVEVVVEETDESIRGCMAVVEY